MQTPYHIYNGKYYIESSKYTEKDIIILNGGLKNDEK